MARQTEQVARCIWMAAVGLTRQQSETHSGDVAMRSTAHYSGYMYYPMPNKMHDHRNTHLARWRNSLLKLGISSGKSCLRYCVTSLETNSQSA